MNNGISQLEQQQQQQLQEIGAQLRLLRERNFLSIEQVTARTMIQPRQLEAIEAGRLSQLPEPIYIRGLIKRYADALGADGEVLAAAFPTTVRMQSKSSSGSVPQLRPIHLYAAYILLIAAAVSGLSYLLNRTAPRMSAPSLADQIPASSTPNTSTDNSALMTKATPTVPQKPVQVAINLTAQSWMRVVVDGKTDFEGILQEGTQKIWTADKGITVRAGNAGGVMLTYNNQQPKPMGKPGTVEELTFSAPDNAAPPNQQAANWSYQANSALR